MTGSERNGHRFHGAIGCTSRPHLPSCCEHTGCRVVAHIGMRSPSHVCQARHPSCRSSGEPKQRIQLKRRRSPVGSTHNSQARVGAGNRSTLRLNAYLPAGTAPAEEHSMSRTRSAESEADSATQQVSATSRVDWCDGCVQAAPVGVRVSCRGYARSRSMAVARDWDGSRTGAKPWPV